MEELCLTQTLQLQRQTSFAELEWW